jgi:hypothetical protein
MGCKDTVGSTKYKWFEKIDLKIKSLKAMEMNTPIIRKFKNFSGVNKEPIVTKVNHIPFEITDMKDNRLKIAKELLFRIKYSIISNMNKTASNIIKNCGCDKISIFP